MNMTETQRLAAIEEIRNLKAKYFRGVDTADTELVRGILAEDCVLDYRGCFVDPASGQDFMPAMNVVLRGNASWTSTAFKEAGIISVHQGHNAEIEVTGDTTARGIWSMTDHIFMPAGGPVALITGHGHYHETYEKIGGAWKIKTIRMTRLRVEAI